jgi:peptidoglycan/LPS O-acetylase OafA/YrhL
MVPRNHSLDGLRGCLAVLVLAYHALLTLGNGSLAVPARFAVWTFFILSACVLTRSWDSRYGAFLLRRLLRLWPAYAVCMAAGYALSGLAPSAWQFAWIPVDSWPPAANSAAWSLTIEAAAMLAMPLIVFVGRGSIARLTIALLATLIAQFFTGYAFYAAFFFVGSWFSRFDVRLPLLGTRLPQWLGRISYPLYICHVPLITFTGLPLWASVPLVFAVAAILCETVEKWSIMASRRVGRLTLKGEGTSGSALQTS